MWQDEQVACEPFTVVQTGFGTVPPRAWQVVLAQVAVVRVQVPAGSATSAGGASMWPADRTSTGICGWQVAQARGEESLFALAVVCCAWAPTVTAAVEVFPATSRGGDETPRALSPWQKVQSVRHAAPLPPVAVT